jgi:hypothetical protein
VVVVYVVHVASFVIVVGVVVVVYLKSKIMNQKENLKMFISKKNPRV